MNKKLTLSGIGLMVVTLVAPWFLNNLMTVPSPGYFAMWRNITPLFFLVDFVAFFLIWIGVIYNVSLPKWAKISIVFVLAGITLWIFMMLQIFMMAFG